MKRNHSLSRSLMLAFACVITVDASEPIRELAADLTFNAPRLVTPSPASGILLLPDGSFLRFVNTATLVEQPTGPVTRYFSDGSLDPSFRFSSDYISVAAAMRLPDGKFIVAAARTAYGAQATEELLRIDSGGTIDSTFPPVSVSNVSTGNVRSLVLLPDGKILVSGPFTQFGNQARPGILRLHPDGSVDTSFAVVPLLSATTGTSPGSLSLDDPIVQPDGKIVIYGNFRRIGNASYPAGIARLNSDGTLDSTFQPTGFSRLVTARTAVIQTDGKVVVGGRFSVTASFAANPTGATYSNLPFIRLNTDGTADQTYGYFGPAAPSFMSMRDSLLQPDGKLLGSNTNGDARTVFRFNTNGTLDTAFQRPLFQLQNPSPNLRAQPVRIERQEDGRLLVTGIFTDVDNPASPGLSRFGVVRLNSDGTVDPTLTTDTRMGFMTWPLSVFSAVQWQDINQLSPEGLWICRRHARSEQFRASE